MEMRSIIAVVVIILILLAWALFHEPAERFASGAPYFRPYRTVGQCVRATGRSMRDCGHEVLGRAYTSLNACVDDGHAYAACSYLPLTPNA